MFYDRWIYNAATFVGVNVQYLLTKAGRELKGMLYMEPIYHWAIQSNGILLHADDTVSSRHDAFYRGRRGNHVKGYHVATHLAGHCVTTLKSFGRLLYSNIEVI